MEQGVDQVLDRRSARHDGPARVGTVLSSIILHSAILAAFVVVPLLARRNAPPIRYAPIVIVPQIETQPSTARHKRESRRVRRPSKPRPKGMTIPSKKAAAPPRPKPQTSEAAAPPPGPSIATLDNPDFTYGYYIDQMLSLIRANWERPTVAPGVQAIVSFQVQRDGTITGIDISQSSGSPAFDFAGLRAVHLASPLPPLPASFSGDSLGVNLILK